MLKKIFSSIFVLTLALVAHINPAHATLTFSATSVASDGNLSLQGNALQVGEVLGGGLTARATFISTETDATKTFYGLYQRKNFTEAMSGIFDGLSAGVTSSHTTGTINQINGISGGATNANAGTVDSLLGGNIAAVNSSSGSVTNATGISMGVTSTGTGNVTNLYAAQANIIKTNSGTVTLATGIRPRVLNISATGALTTVRGIDISAWINLGTISTSYGIYMDTSIDVGTTKYAIYSSSTSQSYLQGNLGIGAATPTAKLDVNGHIASTQSAGAPTASVTGTGYSGASMVSGSTDTKGSITATVGAAAGTLVITFQSAYTTAPVCTVTPATATAQVDVGKMYATTSTSALTLNFVATPTGGSETFSYICIQ